jgi:hypothetical protein
MSSAGTNARESGCGAGDAGKSGGRRPCTGDTIALILGPQVVFLGLPIPPLTDKEQPPRSGSGYQNSGRHVMQPSAPL